MNKSELIAAVSSAADSSKAETDAFLDALTGVIKTHLKHGGDVTIRGFAKFSAIDKPPRVGRNPKTGEVIHSPARRAVKIKALKDLQDAVK